MALTVGVATVLDSREVVVVVTGQRKALALSKAIEEGVNHLVTCFRIRFLQSHLSCLSVVSGLCLHCSCTHGPSLSWTKMLQQVGLFATRQFVPDVAPLNFTSEFLIDLPVFAELHVKTVKYFKSIERVQEEVEARHAQLRGSYVGSQEPMQSGSME